jgi:predicted ATPase
MLTRLQVRGFKSLWDVDVRFGPFTCIAGPNAVGKSNLFDAIQFLSRLASENLLEAALSARSGDSLSSNVRDLFHRHQGQNSARIILAAEMIIPRDGIDFLGQKAEASITTLRYTVEIAFVAPEEQIDSSGLRLISEELVPLPKGEAGRNIQFPHNASRWRDRVVTGKGRRGGDFISTDGNKQEVGLHQEGRGGRTRRFPTADLPRTVLSTVNATESPTALLAKREMESWRLLQLEPSALRLPDNLLARPGLTPSGAHLPATLYSLARRRGIDQNPVDVERVAGRLAELLDDIKTVAIHRDEVRQLFILQLESRNGTTFSARSLSDGTLRFLALATLAEDPSALGVICMEEPENGIQPARIPAILDLLKDIACDPSIEPGDDNPLRQVIINTHSPAVVQLIDDSDLLVAIAEQQIHEGRRFDATVFRWLPETWRDRSPETSCPTVPKGLLLSYLGPITPSAEPAHSSRSAAPRRVRDRQDLRELVKQLNLGFDDAET